MTELNPDYKPSYMDKHTGKTLIGVLLVSLLASGGCAQLLQNQSNANRDKNQREKELLEQQIANEFEIDGLKASSIDTINKSVKLILGSCQVDTEFSPVGDGYNGYDALEDITGYSVTQETDDGTVTRITEFENSFDLTEQVGEDPCAYFFVD